MLPFDFEHMLTFHKMQKANKMLCSKKTHHGNPLMATTITKTFNITLVMKLIDHISTSLISVSQCNICKLMTKITQI